MHCILNIKSNLSTINTPTRLSDPTRSGRRKVKDKFKNTVTVLHVVHTTHKHTYTYIYRYTYAHIRACMWRLSALCVRLTLWSDLFFWVAPDPVFDTDILSHISLRSRSTPLLGIVGIIWYYLYSYNTHRM